MFMAGTQVSQTRQIYQVHKIILKNVEELLPVAFLLLSRPVLSLQVF